MSRKEAIVATIALALAVISAVTLMVFVVIGLIQDIRLAYIFGAALFGVSFEAIRLGMTWRGLSLITIVCMLFLSLLPLEAGFAKAVDTFPIAFTVIFTIATAVVLENKLRPKLNEGITLVQSIAFIFFIINYIPFTEYFPVSLILYLLTLMLVSTSFIHAFSQRKHSRRQRIYLSVFSSIMIFFFAGDYIIRFFLESQPENLLMLSLNYFLFGTACLYIANQFLDLMIYLPGKHRHYDKTHLADIKNLNKARVQNFAKHQLPIAQSLLITISVIIIFSANKFFGWLDQSTLTWLLFWFYTLTSQLLARFNNVTKTK